MEAIKVWQSLCRNVAVLKNDAEETMHGVLAICDKEGISPMQVCQVILDAGFKTAETGIAAALELFFDKEGSEDGPVWSATKEEVEKQWSDDDDREETQRTTAYDREQFTQVEDF